MIEHHTITAILIVSVISGIPLLISTCFSLVVALLQAATQVQEQSIGFLVKIGIVGIVLYLSSGFTVGWVREYFEASFLAIQSVRI